MRALDRDRLSEAATSGSPSRLDLAAANRLMLDATGVGLAVADARTRELLVTNQRLRTWFPAADGAAATLDALLPALDMAALDARLAAGRAYEREHEIAAGRRKLAIAVRITAETGEDGRPVLLLEVSNVSKLRELEYMLESYSTMIERQNRELAAAKDRIERVLLNIMPKTVYDEWRKFGVTAPRLYERATILMLDFVGFTEMAVTADPAALIAELNDIFTGFDRIVEQFGCERLKTIGDAYMAVSGLPVETPQHAANIAGVALRMRRYLEMRNATHRHVWRCRMGIHSGPVVGSIVGVQKYVYDVFGPGVNTAARLEAMAGPMEILVSGATRAGLDPEFRLESLGVHPLRGAGPVEVHRLLGSDALAEGAAP
jgi:class 3 adenylate cyclase